MKTILLLVGVPASGKSYVCAALKNIYSHVPHDSYRRREDYLQALLSAPSPALGEAPFNAAQLASELRAEGCRVHEILITAPLATIAARYKARAGKEYPSNFVTNHSRYESARGRWSLQGTSDGVIVKLREARERM